MGEISMLSTQQVFEAVVTAEKKMHHGKISEATCKTIKSILDKISCGDGDITYVEVSKYYHFADKTAYGEYQSFFEMTGGPVSYYAVWEDPEQNALWNAYQRKFQIWQEVQSCVYQKMGITRRDSDGVQKNTAQSSSAKTQAGTSGSFNENDVPIEVRQRMHASLNQDVMDGNRDFYENVCLPQYPEMPEDIQKQCEDLETRFTDLPLLNDE